MATKHAQIDVLASDNLLAYVPGKTPEGDGVLIVESDGEWVVEGGDTHSTKPDAVQQALAIATRKWG